MSRFYFHVRDDIDAPDAEGEELPDLDAARSAAMRYARDLACAEVQAGCLNLSHRIDIEDAAGKVLMPVTFREAVHFVG